MIVVGCCPEALFADWCDRMIRRHHRLAMFSAESLRLVTTGALPPVVVADELGDTARLLLRSAVRVGMRPAVVSTDDDFTRGLIDWAPHVTAWKAPRSLEPGFLDEVARLSALSASWRIHARTLGSPDLSRRLAWWQPSKAPRVSELAEAVGVSVRTLRRRLAGSYWGGGGRFLRSFQGFAGAQLLLDGYAASRAARILGYGDSRTLADHVAVATGLSPGRLRGLA